MSRDAKDMAIVQKHVDDLGEHFDSVQIFVTAHRPDDGGTVHVNMGSGNWFTRFGQVETWVTREKERTRKEVREEPPDA